MLKRAAQIILLAGASFIGVGIQTANASVSLDGGARHQCAWQEGSDTVNCWMSPNPYDQNVDGAYGQAADYNNSNIVAFASGDYTNCALLSSGNTECWGWIGSDIEYTGADAVSISTGYGQSCVLTNTGNVNCTGHYLTGANNNWQTVYAGGDATWVALSSYAACWATASSTNLTCKGWNVTEPTWATEGTALPAVGGHYAMCVLLDHGNVDCMNNGYNEVGQTAGYFAEDAIDADGQFDVTCVATEAGNVECWGRLNDSIRSHRWTEFENVGAVQVSVTGSDDICYASNSGDLGCSKSTPAVTTIVTDTDGDGVNDDEDAFPNDPNETMDTDGDGVGDNSDVFPNDSSESADADNDGLGDNADANDNSDTSSEVSVNGVATPIANTLFADGNTLADLINEGSASCLAGAKNHGKYVSCMAKVLNALLANDVITDAEKDQLQSAAAQSDTGFKKKGK